ncbi:Ankyrin repeat-containing protein [Methylomagnum ishizawai]|uniref:Ankyrin repeat-containing protein n=1 Tax=Methylomagnum ishizawai TaxID=1760988 RepID=A0A1Y6CWY1_9GAMM|nr:ankyrin repeat domain-containing protein [Methylomagnum ishizawai]SMF95168.1 Ankyrin repeat-containing protein [Methylomagnum ishizawai]
MIQYDAFDAIRDNALERLKEFSAHIESGGYSWSPMHEAAKLGRTELLKYILAQRFVDINDEFEIGEPDDFRRGTALTEALLNGHVETAVFLIEQGANVNAEYYGYENTHCLGLEFEESGNCLTLALATGNSELIRLIKPFE